MGASGTVTVDFSTGKDAVAVSVSGQTAIQADSITGAWIAPAVTANNDIDDHVIERLNVLTGPASAGTGFVIYVNCTQGKAYGVYNVAWAWV